MSLIMEINRIDTNKNKIKTVANNIDNKLVELGGEQAMNLASVPNKLKKLTESYRKTVKKTINKRINYYDNPTQILYETAFTPKIVIIKMKNNVNTDINYINVTDVLGVYGNSGYVDFRREGKQYDRLHFDSISNGFKVGNRSSDVVYTVIDLIMIG